MWGYMKQRRVILHGAAESMQELSLNHKITQTKSMYTHFLTKVLHAPMNDDFLASVSLFKYGGSALGHSK